MTIQLHVPPALESRLQAEATARGEDVETVVVHTLLEKFGANLHASPDSSRLSVQEFETELSELAFDGPTLPADFSRADIYNDDH
jgi:hypothetical protein